MILFNNIRRPGLLQILFGFFVLFAFLYVGFFITKWILYGLGFLAPALLIAAAILNFSTIKNFVKYLWGLIRVKPILGLALTLLAIVGFPITCTILFLRAWSQWRKRKNYMEEVTADGSEFIDYEVVDDQRGRKRPIDLLEQRD